MRALQLLMSALLSLFTFGCSLGTEVGNGARVNKSGTPAVNTDTQGEQAQTDTMSSQKDGSSAGAPQTSIRYAKYLRVSCASPFAEAKTGTWISSAGYTVELKAQGNEKILKEEGQEFKVQSKNLVLEPYSISITPDEVSLRCLSVLSEAKGNALLRKVTFSDQLKLSWKFEAQDVVFMSLENMTGEILETWSKP